MGIHDNKNVSIFMNPETTPEPSKRKRKKGSIKVNSKELFTTLEPPRQYKNERPQEFQLMKTYGNSYDYFELSQDEYFNSPSETYKPASISTFETGRTSNFDLANLDSTSIGSNGEKENFGDAWGDVVKVSNDAGDWIDNNILEPAEKFFNAADPTTWWKDVDKAFTQFGDMIKDAADDVKDEFVDFGNDMKRDFIDFGNFWEDFFNTVGNGFMDAANTVGSTMTDGFNSISAGFEEMTDFFEQIPETFTDIFNDVGDIFTKTIPGIFASDGVVGEFFTKTLPEGLEYVFVEQVGGTLTKIFTKDLPLALEEVFVKQIGGTLSTFFTVTVKDALTDIFVKQIGANVSSFFTDTVLPELQSVFLNIIPGFFESIWKQISNNFGDYKMYVIYAVLIVLFVTMILPPLLSESIKKLFNSFGKCSK